MNDIAREDLKRAFAAIERIFLLPPASEAEFRQRVSGIDAEAARQVLATRLRNSDLESEMAGLFFMLSDEFKLARTYPNVLIGIVNDRNRKSTDRCLALNLLIPADPDIVNSSKLALTSDELMDLMAGANSQVFADVLEEPDGGIGIAELLLDAGPEALEDFFDEFDGNRVWSATPAALAYRKALRFSELDYLRRDMLDAIVLEGSEAGIYVLEELLENAPDPQARYEIQAALMKTKTHAMEGASAPRSSGPDTAAYMGNCDGQGAFILLLRCQAQEGLLHVADICIRAASDIRDAFTLARRPPEMFDEMLQSLAEQGNSTMVRIPLGHAASILSSAIDRTESMNRPISPEVENTLLLAEWMTGFGREDAGAPFTGDETLPDTDGAVPEKAAADLLEERAYETWFFDSGDLSDIEGGPSKAISVEQLAATDLPQRVGAMARHMAWWHLWRSELDRAALCAQTARQIDQNFTDCTLMSLMLRRSRSMNGPDGNGPEETQTHTFGDPKQRQILQVECFPRLINPKGKHLAFLDLTEIAMTVVEELFTEFPGEVRPRDSVLSRIAFAIAKPAAEMIIEGNDPINLPQDKRRFTRMRNTVCRHAACDEETGSQISAHVVFELMSFVNTICRSCPVRCFDRPTADMASVFFSPIHPATSEEVDDEVFNDVYDRMEEEMARQKPVEISGNIVKLPVRKTEGEFRSPKK